MIKMNDAKAGIKELIGSLEGKYMVNSKLNKVGIAKDILLVVVSMTVLMVALRFVVLLTR